MDKPGAYSMTPRFTTAAASSTTSNQRSMLTRMSSADSMEVALKLSEQDAQYGTNMHDSLTAADEPEIEKLIRNGFAEHEALLEIFNRKFVRDYVPQTFKRRDPPPVSRSAPPPMTSHPPPPQRGVVRNNRYSKQWAVDHMNQYDLMQLTLLLSEQEAQHGVNMYDAMTYEDEMEVDALVHSGRYTADQAIRYVFDRNYPPRHGGGSSSSSHGHQPIHRTTSAYAVPRRDPYPPSRHEYVPAPAPAPIRTEYDYPPPAAAYEQPRISPVPRPQYDPYYPPAAGGHPPPYGVSPAPSPHYHQPLHHSSHTQSFYREPLTPSHYGAPPPMQDPYYRGPPVDPYAVPSPVGYGPPPMPQQPQQQHRLVAAPSIVNIQQQQFEELQRAVHSDERRRLDEERRRLEEERRQFEEERRRNTVSDVHNRIGARDSSPQPRDRVYRRDHSGGNGSVAGGSVYGGSVHGGSVHGGSVRASSPTPSTGSAATGVTASSARRRTSFNDGSSVDGGSVSGGSKSLGDRKKSIFSFLSTASNKDGAGANSSPANKSMTYREKDVKQVMELGYGRELAVAALIEANNNVKLAIQILASR